MGKNKQELRSTNYWLKKIAKLKMGVQLEQRAWIFLRAITFKNKPSTI
jgi:hypothetical protein